jgi:hypothetical protein
MFFIDFGDFLNNHLSFDFSIAKHICLFLHVFHLDLSDIKRTQSFCHVIFSRNIRPWEEVTGNATRKEIGEHAGPLLDCMVGLISPSCVLLTQYWTSRTRLDVKLTIPRTPWAISRRGDGETQNTKFWSKDCKDRRGYAAGAAPGCPFASIDTISFNNMRSGRYKFRHFQVFVHRQGAHAWTYFSIEPWE